MDKKPCTFFEGPAQNNQEVILQCDKPVEGRKVELKIVGQGVLNFADSSVTVLEGMFNFIKIHIAIVLPCLKLFGSS